MLTYDETPALAARARIAARAVLGLVLGEQRAARFVYEYSSTYFRQGIAGEAEHKAELLSAIERESLLLIAERIERALPRAMASLFSRLSESEATAAFRQSFLTYLGGSLAWDNDEREAFRKDLALYLRLAARESRAMVRRPGAPQVGGAFVDRCAFLVDPSMLAQAREAAARYQAQLESCAEEALRAAFRGLHGRPSPVTAPMARPEPSPKPRIQPQPRGTPARRTKPQPKPKRRSNAKTKAKRKAKAGPIQAPRVTQRLPIARKARVFSPRRKSSPRRKTPRIAKPAARGTRPSRAPARKRSKK